MIEDIIQDAEVRMQKSVASLEDAFKRIRTGRAHPSILDAITVSYYGSETQISQVANIIVEEGRTLLISPWEKSMISDIEKAILKSDLGLNPANNGDTLRVPMPVLTEETRREYTKQAKNEAENARIALRNIRRDANSHLKDLEKDKEISEDDQRRSEERIQKLTDTYVGNIESIYQVKETDLLSI
ncbi:MAG: ribosome recycling factor [Gammaproteobacteria bacterium]|nr:ribosome recycling factor [Gammaproteobacteria bacterium]MDB2445447.1 ribosome recycling factor [Gammaproteobacteria bacterium]MDG0998855.1 ribosome recycling factor [Gammaproteobacteria bacterium]MDG1951728.1 ribosome recycling factor [Gammaproteobacteria bacterium]MDG2118270.1 ribosome recycling factor [Gammaproteobacteria bacterium]